PTGRPERTSSAHRRPVSPSSSSCGATSALRVHRRERSWPSSAYPHRFLTGDGPALPGADPAAGHRPDASAAARLRVRPEALRPAAWKHGSDCAWPLLWRVCAPAIDGYLRNQFLDFVRDEGLGPRDALLAFPVEIEARLGGKVGRLGKPGAF